MNKPPNKVSVTMSFLNNGEKKKAFNGKKKSFF